MKCQHKNNYRFLISLKEKTYNLLDNKIYLKRINNSKKTKKKIVF